ncbi:MAG TPA: undecaprenyl-diphosphate phosphatase [Bdellovibrionota bacterium]|nr:undecaprenyl-diphosphate phosphatase [Bdellovibrionota bacterium]
MPLFESLVHAALHGATLFLPVSPSAHEWLLTRLAHLQEPDAATSAAMALGALLALVVFFRHDWSSILSGLLQTILLRRRPMTLDERMPLFLLVATAPVLIFSSILASWLDAPSWGPAAWATILAGGAALLAFADRMSRKTRRWVDWNWVDALGVGVAQALSLVPGSGRFEATWLLASARNYSLEAACKFAYYALLPLLIADLVRMPPALMLGGAPWWHDVLITAMACAGGWVALGAVQKGLRLGRTLNGYLLYRLILAAGALWVGWREGW